MGELGSTGGDVEFLALVTAPRLGRQLSTFHCEVHRNGSATR
jgi:hypothetical protein